MRSVSSSFLTKGVCLRWQESNSLRLQNKIYGDSLPQNLQYDSITAFCRLPLTQKFSVLTGRRVSATEFFSG